MSAAVVDRLRAAGCVFAEDEAALLIEAAAGSTDVLDRLVALRVSGRPLEHVLGWVMFCGRRIAVAPGVFVPRRRTSLLVRLAEGLLQPGSVVVDMCCGSGALGAVLENAQVHAVDVDPAAVACARRNVPSGLVYLGDLFAPLPASLRGRVDVVVANAPYVPTAAISSMPPEAREHEPTVALDGGEDGLDVQRRIVSAAPSWLAPEGAVVLETSRAQAARLASICAAEFSSAQVVEDDELDGTAVLALR